MQKKFISWKDPISSFNANRKYAGILPTSRMMGFDKINIIAGLHFSIGHDNSGGVFLDQDLTSTDPTGVWVTRQGAVIEEDEPIEFDLITNSGNTSYRNDLVIGRHHHDIVYPGGIGATYEIVEGALNSNIIPVPTGNDWVLLATLRIPPGAVDLVSTTVIIPPNPGLGGSHPAQLDRPNRFTAMQQEAQQATAVSTTNTNFEINNRATLSLLEGGNLFRISSGPAFLDLIPNKPDGTKIQIIFDADTTVRPFLTQLVGGTGGTGVRAGYAAGYRPIVINHAANDNLIVKANQIATFIKINLAGTFASGHPVYGDFWKLINVSDTPFRTVALETQVTGLVSTVTDLSNALDDLIAQVNGINPIGNVRWIDYVGDILNDFDAGGLAHEDSIYKNHRICNGVSGTPDMTGKVVRGWNPNITDYSTIGDSGGSDGSTILQANLPNVDFHIKGSNPKFFHGTAQDGGNYTHGLAPAGSPANGAELLISSGGSGDTLDTRDPYIILLPIIRIV